MTTRILVAGIGNIFLGDDGFGCEVVRNADIPRDDSSVRVVDYGIRGMHLAYDLLEDWDTLVLVDAVPNRGSPGTLHVFRADLEADDEPDHASGSAAIGMDGHSMDPAAVFASLRALGGSPPYTVVVGCEAGSVEEGIGLSVPVAEAVPRAARAVGELVAALKTSSAQASSRGGC
ncbi:peptidase M52 [Mycobacterium alsense]|uniref:hydrogenase maturation protease n=1 Tax=Mycobacterium alsense TaxID=324058 RepID=UPI00080185A2|nr:hydrogenase maturation protease [Mycobacterium alsense]OBI95086.1 peptidase M52 [Mycobacterium alsense]